MLENKLRGSGLPLTILRPGLFMDGFRGASLPFARTFSESFATIALSWAVYLYINRPQVFHNFSDPKDFSLSLPNYWVGRENARG